MTTSTAKPMVLVNEKDKVLGYKEKFATHKNPVPLHRAISIVLFNKNHSEMLITKRAKVKPTWPYYWTNAVCSHPYPGESYCEAADRRLKEELGIATKLKEVFRFSYEAKMNKTWGEHELDATFMGVFEGPLLPNPDEIAGYEWMEIAKLKQELKKNPARFTPWFHLIVKKVL